MVIFVIFMCDIQFCYNRSLLGCLNYNVVGDFFPKKKYIRACIFFLLMECTIYLCKQKGFYPVCDLC